MTQIIEINFFVKTIDNTITYNSTYDIYRLYKLNSFNVTYDKKELRANQIVKRIIFKQWVLYACTIYYIY